MLCLQSAYPFFHRRVAVWQRDLARGACDGTLLKHQKIHRDIRDSETHRLIMTYRYITVIYSAYRRVLMSMEPQYGDQGAWPWEKAANSKFRFCIDLGAMHSYAIKRGKTWKNTKKTSLAVPTVTYVHSELDPVKSDPWSTWSDFVYGRSRRELRSVSYIDAWQQLKRKEKQSLERAVCFSFFSIPARKEAWGWSCAQYIAQCF